MKFLFRTPLFDFDPENESEIQKNWIKIMEAISISSASLANEIRDQQYDQLSKSVRLKVKKYILRGRYRSTPFGKFAGVGLGSFNLQKFSLDLEQVVKLGPKYTSMTWEDNSQEWHLSTVGFSQFDRKVFLSYHVREERWALLGIPSNKVISQLINHCKAHQGIRFSEFRLWFKDESQNSVEEIWMHLIELGILYQSEEWLKTKITPSVYTDIFLADRLGISDEINNVVQDFFQTSGPLFSQVSSSYLGRLKKWFQNKIDDRFIPLPFLLAYQEFTSSDFLELNPNGENSKESFEIPTSCWGLEEVDLRKIVKEAPLDPQIYHLDLVFKALDDGRIVIDNAICNRPFVFIGRFNRHEEVFALAQEIKGKVYPSQELIYAEVRIFETHVVQGICETRPIFDKFISPFYQKDPNCIPFEEIEMGLRDDEFLLVHNKTGKRIIPIVTHPLNGKEISHPLIRLLWELDHQKGFKLTHYQSPQFISSNYSPRLTWGKTVLQPRKWVVFSYQFEVVDELKKWLNEQALPTEISVGIYDRELLINWESEDGFEILWTELRKHPKCVLSEVLWKDKSPFTSTTGKPIYPQLIISHRKAINEQPWSGFLNSIDHENSWWLYVVFWVAEEDFEDSILLLFSFGFIDYLKKKSVQWYYLVYPDSEQLQVRMRFLANSRDQKGEILSFIVNNLSYQLRFEQRPYFPEVKKYGASTYQISEELFWMESRLIVEIIRRTVSLSGPSEIGIECLSQFWADLIYAAGLESYGFKMVKSKVKRMSFELKRNFAVEPLNAKPHRKLPLKWKKEYRLKLMTHLSHWGENNMKWQVISNHLHMQVNRFYSVNRKRMEDWLYYLLYKEMGKRIFGKRDFG